MPYIIRQDDISVAPLSIRAQNCLRRGGIHTIGAMLDYPTDELINIHNMGKKNVGEIQQFVQNLISGTGEYILVENNDSVADESAISWEKTDSKDSVKLFLDETHSIIQDIPIKNLQLSVRAKNCLTRDGYNYVSQLFGISYDKLMDLENMGKKSAEEVLAYVDKISISHVSNREAGASISHFDDLAIEMCSAYGQTENIWKREILTIKTKYPEAIGETLIYRLYDNTFVRNTVKSKILQILEENNEEISKAALEEHFPQHLNNTTILEEILLELETISAVEMGEVMIYRQYPSIVEFAAHIENDRIREVIRGKIEGKTLQEIGEQCGVTRERVRQLMQKGLCKKPYLREDKYAYLYDHYDFSLEDFVLAYDEPQETYNYLEMISTQTRAKRKPIEDLLTDDAVPIELRRRAEKAIYKQYITLDGVRVRKQRPALVKHYIKTYCRELTTYDDFFQKYHEWLNAIGLGDNIALILESRSYENKLNQCNYVLWNQWKRFRYYSIPEQDFEELLSTLDFEQFEGTEISTLKLFRDYPDLMQQYNIHDEYELHNLLKKIWPLGNNSVKFKKMPTIEIGTADPINQLFDLLLQYAPVSADDLANHYEEEYGVKATTVKGNYLRSLDYYYYRGVYSVDFANLPDIQFNRMQVVLERDFYTTQEVKRLYKREFPSSDESLINPHTLKTLNFRVYSGYVVKNTYPSATDYFRYLLTADDIVDARNISKSIQNVVAYSSELYSLRSEYRIIEFSPLQYINIRRLNDVGVKTDNLESYCKSVASFYEKGEYFTVTSLRRDGFTHEIDDLGFDEWFYASVLLEDREHFSYQRIGGTRVFLRGKANANLSSMLIWLLEKRQKIDFYDLMDLLESHYGIVLPKEKLLTIIDSTELYYDTIMEAVYIDYDTYFEEI